MDNKLKKRFNSIIESIPLDNIVSIQIVVKYEEEKDCLNEVIFEIFLDKKYNFKKIKWIPNYN